MILVCNDEILVTGGDGGGGCSVGVGTGTVWSVPAAARCSVARHRQQQLLPPTNLFSCFDYDWLQSNHIVKQFIKSPHLQIKCTFCDPHPIEKLYRYPWLVYLQRHLKLLIYVVSFSSYTSHYADSRSCFVVMKVSNRQTIFVMGPIASNLYRSKSWHSPVIQQKFWRAQWSLL